ncbi:hypothetical protein V6238_19600, partial [Marinomonas arenicola]|uniref:hypothetical protein n=1 Tax=Marinomonas arenicola TaxID=569601 RepID=UPI00311D8E24
EHDSDVEDDIDWPDPSEITISAKKCAGKWLVEAVVMGHRFEQITGGSKKSAIESLRDQYKKETE